MNDFAALPEPTSDEKTMATLAQVLQLVGWWIAPLIIYLLRRESKFVSFHTMQALLWQCILLVLWFGGIAVWLVIIFATVIPHTHNAPPNSALPLGFFAGGFSLWLGMGIMALNLFIGIFYGVQAGHGQWAAYPVIGRRAHRIVGA